MSDIMERLLKEEKEAEELMYGKNEEEPSKEAPSPEEDEDEVDAPEEETVEESEEPKEDPKPKPKRENWKKRFIGYKSATDKTISELRTSNADLYTENESLRKRLNELSNAVTELKRAQEEKVDPFEGVFSQEDVDLLGPEALEAMKKAALAMKVEKQNDSSELEELKTELEEIRRREREKVIREAKKSEELSLKQLKDKLATIVPNFEKIDTDPNFGEFLQDVDDYSDRVRMDLFTTAVNSRDVAGAARFYQEYAQRKAKKSSFMDDHITPTGDGATESDPESRQPKRYHISEYEQFMNDLAVGRYKGREKEARKIEMMYDKAYVEGRIYE